MQLLLQYAKADGRIMGVWQAIPETMLPEHVTDGTEIYAFALTETELSPIVVLNDYAWVDGALVPKEPLELVATPNPFQANGDTECQITVAPFTPCTLLVNGQPYALTDEDRTLLLTSTRAQPFDVRLEPVGRYKAEALRVEAIRATT